MEDDQEEVYGSIRFKSSKEKIAMSEEENV